MDSENLQKIINKNKKYFDIKIIGKSHLKEDIYAINKIFDKKLKWAIISGGIHAREHLTCDLICLFLKKIKNIKKSNYNISFIPLINPDGADLCLNGIKNINKKNIKKILKINNNNYDFSLFKANARGVDLNNNFDANFEKKYSSKNSPASQGYYGKKPFSEPEAKALKKWTEKLSPFLTLSYHLKGEEIYFDFFQDEQQLKRDFEIAKVFADSTGYKIKSTQEISSGGYKDWCVQKLKIPALTIEVGDDKFSHPFPQKELKSIYKKNKNIFKDINKALKIYLDFDK